MNILKGIGAIVAGLIFIVVTHTATDFILQSMGIFTPINVRFDTTWMLVTAIIYRSIFNIGGGYLTAVLSPEPKMRVVILLGLFGTVMGIAGVIASRVMDLGPLWYPLVLVALGMPSVWFGGYLYTKRRNK